MEEATIGADEFARRLRALVQGGVGPGLPRRRQDQHILLKAVALGLARELPCSERDLGAALQRWLAAAGPRVDLDAVTLRRALVDFGYLRRDPAGERYEPGAAPAMRFAPDVDPQPVLSRRQGNHMAKGYWIARVDVADPERYKAYMAANAGAFRKFGARFLVRAGRFENPEGTSRARNVVIEFPSYQAALDCWRSPEYQAALQLRLPVATGDLVIVEGYDGPQPE